MYHSNVIITRAHLNNVENFKGVKSKPSKPGKNNKKISFRKMFQSEIDCVDNIKDAINKNIPEPVDSISSTNKPFEFKGSCNWEQNHDLNISSSKLGNCSGCPINDMGSIKASPKECKKWCGSVPGCNAITTENGRCYFRNQAYYTEPSIDEDSYFKSLNDSNKWIVKENRKIPNSTMNKKHQYHYQYNNLAENDTEQYPYYPQPYQKGLSPDYATLEKSSVKDCKNECSKNEDCTGFTFNHRNKQCTMKRHVINGEVDNKSSKCRTSYICD